MKLSLIINLGFNAIFVKWMNQCYFPVILYSFSSPNHIQILAPIPPCSKHIRSKTVLARNSVVFKIIDVSFDYTQILRALNLFQLLPRN